MVSSSEVRITCPSISFLFTRLGGSLGVFPHLENFIFEGNSLGIVVADLLPLLHQSIDWFRDLVREVMSEVKSSELETGLSSSGDPVEGDTTVSTPLEVRAFYALNEECGLDNDTLGRFKDKFQFPEWVRVRLPSKGERACNFFPGEVCFYKSSFACGLRFLVHLNLMELLNHFGIAPGQLMPNSWRIVVSYMGIWLAIMDEDMLRVNKLVYLYRLKASKEYGYYELVPWERSTRIVRELPSSFKYWKSIFFFVSRDDFETPSGRVWGELPRLHRRWGTLTLGVSMFLFIILSFILLIVIATDSLSFSF